MEILDAGGAKYKGRYPTHLRTHKGLAVVEYSLSKLCDEYQYSIFSRSDSGAGTGQAYEGMKMSKEVESMQTLIVVDPAMEYDLLEMF